MTDAERERLRDEVAGRVMGWSLAEVSWAYGRSVQMWHAGADVPLLTRDTWRPDESDAQCMQVLDRMVELDFDYALGGRAGRASAGFGPGAATACEEHAERRIALLRAALAALDAAPPGRSGSGRDDG